MTTFEAQTFASQPGLYRYRAGHAPSPEQRREISHALAALRGDLDEVTIERDERIATVILSLHVAMAREIPRTERMAVIAAYAQGLVGRPAAAIEEAVRRFYADETDLPRGFMPKPPELAHIVKAVAAEWNLIANRLERLLRLEEEPVRETPKLSEADAARLAAARASMSKTMPSLGKEVRR